jgi:predicted phage-related endonuclease
MTEQEIEAVEPELVMIEADDSWAAKIANLKAARDAIRQWEEVAKELAEQVKTDLTARGADGVTDLVRLRRTRRETVDTKALRARYPEVAASCAKVTEVTAVVLL